MANEFLHNYDTENPSLKPCPFCGNKPVWHLQGNIHTIKKLIIVKCNQCGVDYVRQIFNFMVCVAHYSSYRGNYQV